MPERADMLEAALNVYPEGLALIDPVGRVIYWNRAAEIFTGHASANLVGRELPQSLEPLMSCGVFEHADPRNGGQGARGTLIHAQHVRGHDLPAIARRVILRDLFGARIGTAMVFHPAEQNTALPHGDTCEGSEVKESQAELRERLEAEFEAWVEESIPLGVLWITVDQAAAMRKTHGPRACEAMLESMERTLANNLRPGDEVGRWGDDEFLVLSHEPDAHVLGSHGQVLAGIARTTDFRWWGDRISLSVSIGAARAQAGNTLAHLLECAQSAMQASMQAGGNHVTLAPGGQS